MGEKSLAGGKKIEMENVREKSWSDRKGLFWKLAFPAGNVLRRLGNNRFTMKYIHGMLFNNRIGRSVRFHGLTKIYDSSVGDYSYLGGGGTVVLTTIGKFCSIGPHFISGWGRHPLDGISTHPMFYSTARQNGISLADSDRFEEHLPITIGNDVFIGANVIVLDGVTIGDGAVVGAGAVVAADVPSYAVVGGVPAKVIRYRFDDEVIRGLLEVKWWDFPEERLQDIADHFYDPGWLIGERNSNDVSNAE